MDFLDVLRGLNFDCFEKKEYHPEVMYPVWFRTAWPSLRLLSHLGTVNNSSICGALWGCSDWMTSADP